MLDIGRIISYGHSLITDKSQSWVYRETNRLYYIHSGKGGFNYRGKYTELKAGYIYFIPFLADVELICDRNDRIIHTYASFELIPPIISNEVLEFDPSCDKEAECALKTFLTGGKMQILPSKASGCKCGEYSEDFLQLCKVSIAYLTSKIITALDARPIEDKIIISALKIMHDSLSDNITVENLAKKYYITPDGFIRKFRAEVGITPYSYLKRLRIRTAYFMKDRGEPLEKIAKATGYSDSSSLLHAMKSLK